MKAIKKFAAISLCALFIIQGTPVFANVAQGAESVDTQSKTQIEVTPRADIIEWRYKEEGGKYYKRQYNCSKQIWIGEWILIA